MLLELVPSKLVFPPHISTRTICALPHVTSTFVLPLPDSKKQARAGPKGAGMPPPFPPQPRAVGGAPGKGKKTGLPRTERSKVIPDKKSARARK